MFASKQTPQSFGTRTQHSVRYKYLQKKEFKEQSGYLITGVRGIEFVQFIKNILIKYGSLTEVETNTILSDKTNVKMFETCFVHSSYDEKYNYELYEHFGDKIVDYSISKYILEKYPKLGDVTGYNPSLALKIVSKLHLYLRSKAFLSKAGENLGFKKFISGSSAYLLDDSASKSVYEDIFEAFMGVCDRVINKTTTEDVGYIICYEILKHIFDKMNISIKYEFIIDARTRLKEYVQKRQSEGFSYSYLTKSSIITSYIKFKVTDLTTRQTYDVTTPPIITSSKAEGVEKAYEQFYIFVSKLNGNGISGVELVQTYDEREITGGPKDYATQVSIIVNGQQTLYDVGYGYDEASSKEAAAENALNTIKAQGIDVSVGGWNEKDWI